MPICIQADIERNSRNEEELLLRLAHKDVEEMREIDRKIKDLEVEFYSLQKHLRHSNVGRSVERIRRLDWELSKAYKKEEIETVTRSMWYYHRMFLESGPKAPSETATVGGQG